MLKTTYCRKILKLFLRSEGVTEVKTRGSLAAMKGKYRKRRSRQKIETMNRIAVNLDIKKIK